MGEVVDNEVWIVCPHVRFQVFVPFPILTSFIGFSRPRPHLRARGDECAERPDKDEVLLAEGSSESEVTPPGALDRSRSRALCPDARNESEEVVTVTFAELSFFQLRPMDSVPRRVVFSGATEVMRGTTGSVGVGGELPRDLPDKV